ncbi:hypothetical protein Sj15T_09660 [Sphingobium sp. TA15]|uniref:Uncharacterized protein n=1 Tax=Sphingobium indicum (strain DSM 16413 / CCM 7287 / MTCC 6362 / UT26 / NBRC 101211 / UT26S) TaxID=452662 RepID=D4Z229_SPHIU|nr:hypothetical protein [Sphingobium indicum]BAI96661.1 hypothetical protein SJA_C1-18270 [Sphingobium indicum UT26S]BDD65945.1 hypothetical protein Sj15T_09660 [Sphingobium sp. TA15]
MPQIEVQVVARTWVNRRITVDAPNEEIAAGQAIALAKASLGDWEVAGARDYIQVRMDPQDLTDFGTDEIRIEE